jgi:hypothetical protein
VSPSTQALRRTGPRKRFAIENLYTIRFRASSHTISMSNVLLIELADSGCLFRPEMQPPDSIGI